MSEDVENSGRAQISPIRAYAAGRGAWQTWAVLTLLLLPATYPLWKVGLPASHDGLHHLFRLFALDRGLRGGFFYPRWFGEMGLGYGYPVLHYYAPFLYYLAETFHLLGGGYILSMEIVTGLGVVASGWTMYAFLSTRWGRASGILGALAYVYYPYHLANAYLRGALPELWAMVWIPLVLRGVDRLAHRTDPEARKRDFLLTLWSMAALMITHQLSALLLALVMVLYFLFLRWGGATWRGLLRSAVALGAGVALTAFYWVPTLVDLRYVYASMAPAHDPIWKQLVGGKDLVSPYFFLYRYFPNQGVAIEHPLPGYFILLAALGMGVALWRWRHYGRLRKSHFLFFLTLSVASVLSMHRMSTIVWKGLPFLSYLQFPWRWQGMVALGFGGLVGLTLAPAIPKVVQPHRMFRVVVLMLLFLVMLLPPWPRLPLAPLALPGRNTPMREQDVNLKGLSAYEFNQGLWLRVHGGPWLWEYLPVWAVRHRSDFFIPREPPPSPDSGPAIPASVSVRLGRQTPYSHEMTVDSPNGLSLSWHGFYFPAWKARIDGHDAAVSPMGELGLMGVDVPAGSHRVSFRWHPTRSMQFGAVISGWTLLLLAVWVLRKPRWPVHGKDVAGLGVLVMLLLALAWQMHAHPAAYTPKSVHVDFGGKVLLAGDEILPESVSPGGQTEVTLYWVALRFMDRNYKVFLHLEDEGGRRYAQVDEWPWFDTSPTTRWQPGEVMADTHVLSIPANVPPGRYLLWTGLYQVSPFADLPARTGGKESNRFLLGELVVR